LIVDVHAHLMDQHRDLEATFVSQAAKAAGHDVDLSSHWDTYLQTSPPDTVAIVLGGKARLSGIWVEDNAVAELVAAHPKRTIGFLSLDPTQPGWEDELRFGHQQLGLRGIKLMPMYAGFDPGSDLVRPLWRYASDHGLPVLMHTGTTFMSQAVLKYTRPVIADDIARDFPDLRLILAHLGHPYEGECLAVIRKHPNVYADISALHYRPHQFWNALMLAQEYGVWHKLLFGSDFPFTTVDDTITELRRLASIRLPGFGGLDGDQTEALIQRDALSLLGLSLER
jgi:predicted TIM-barrel fold metal-dependent hydrolase